MKKITLLMCALALVLISCNKDDDNGSSSQDAFIGNWKFFKSFENDVEQDLLPCESEGFIVVSANGTYTFTYFNQNLEGDCIQNPDVEVGTWENVGNGNYSFTFDGFTYTEQIFFEENRFYILDTETFDGETFVYKDVYIRQSFF